mmetsp:Transcript_31959/g.74851  ORF Transcript_31959/g.74851 Transcript_31959/m.74851 type:complete len:1064 (+) Transcript_31959:62-3253(+)
MGRKAKAKPQPEVARSTNLSTPRGAPPPKRPRTSPVEFPPNLARFPFEQSESRDSLRFNITDVSEVQSGSNPSDVWLHGVTMNGESVAVLVHGFRSYFYCSAPAADMGISDEGVCASLAARLMKGAGSRMESVTAAGELVTGCERLRRKGLMFYQPDAADFLRIELCSPRLLATAAKEVERGMSIPRGSGAEAFDYKSQVWEAFVPFVLRFMIDTGLVGGGWVEFSPGSYTVVPTGDRQTRAQLEARAHCSAVRALAPEGELMALAPLRILVLDARSNEDGCVGTVSAVLSILGASEPLAQVAWIQSSTPKDHSLDDRTHQQLYFCSDESDMLQSVQAFVAHCDPDILAGYEMQDRIMPLLLGRATALRTPPSSLEFGRFRGEQSKLKTGQGGPQGEQRKEVACDGRLVFDISKLVERESKLTSYALPFVVHHFLGRTHFDLQASKVTELLRELPEALAQHCLQDAIATLQLLDRLCFTYNLFEMARVTGVPIDYLLTRGQMIKVTSQILRKARTEGFLMPARGATGDENTYEGGFVMEPRTNLYVDPVVVLDFASLYPSIMMAHNICYTTLLPEGGDRALKLEQEAITEAPAFSGTGVPHKFVRRNLQPGLLPRILEELLAARKVAKKEMAAEKDPKKRSVLNGRQLALKISANSVYGFTGATQGNLPCLEIAASVTAYGREMITSTAKFIEETCQETCVVYGDTDSVMLHFGPVTRAQAVERGKEAAAQASQRFQAPIKLEFEKVLQPFLLLNKKRYAGRPWNGDKQLTLDMKGIETVRRDWCGLVRKVCENVLDMLLRPEPSVEAALEYVRSIFTDLRCGAVDLSLLVISKSLGKKGDSDYVAKAAHVELAEKLRKRDPRTAPRAGDRVAYVVVGGAPNAKLYEKAEDPRYAQENGLPSDADYYIEQQLLPPLLRILEPVAGSKGEDPTRLKSRLLAGGQQARKIATPSAVKGGLGAFLKKAEKCLACGGSVTGAEPFCKVCAGSEKETAARKAKEVEGRASRTRHTELRQQCKTCVGQAAGDLHESCCNVDCPIFFERGRVAKALGEAEGAFKRLSLDW